MKLRNNLRTSFLNRFLRQALWLSMVLLIHHGTARVARATSLCVYVPVDIEDRILDTTAFPRARPIRDLESGGVSYMAARGMWGRLERWTGSAWTDVVAWGHIPNNGCFLFTVFGTTTKYRVSIKSYGQGIRTSGVNHFLVHPPGSRNGFNTYTKEFNGNLGVGGIINALMSNFVLPRIYAIMAYMEGNFVSGGAAGWQLHVNNVTDADIVCSSGTPETADSLFCVDENGELRIRLRDDPSALARFGSKHAYLMVHEYGHAQRVISGLALGVTNWGAGGDYNNTTSRGGCVATVNSHEITSEEWQSAAASEGWAHFVATDAWTIHPTTDSNPVGWMNLYYNETVVSAETGEFTVFRDHYCLDQCLCSDLGHGVELDWLRQFWDYHTNNQSGDGDYRDHAELRNDLALSTPWDREDTFYSFQDRLATGPGLRWSRFGSSSGTATGRVD